MIANKEETLAPAKAEEKYTGKPRSADIIMQAPLSPHFFSTLLYGALVQRVRSAKFPQT